MRDLEETVNKKIEINVRFQDNFVFTECRKRENETLVLFHFIFFGHLGLLWYFTWKVVDQSLQGNNRIITLLNCSDRLSQLVMVASFLA